MMNNDEKSKSEQEQNPAGQIRGQCSDQRGEKTYGRLLAVLFVSVFCILYMYQNVCFILKDTGPGFNLFSDSHFLRTVHMRDVYEKTGSIAHLFSSGNPYPPLVYAWTLAVYGITDVSMTAARLSLVLFTLIFLLSMFGIGYFYGGYWGGISVMALGASSPYVLMVSRTYVLDYPQTAMTALVFYLILKSEGFGNRKYSLLTGLAMAASFLVKWSTAFFIVLPVFWFIVPHLFRDRWSLKPSLILSAVMITCAGGYCWFAKNSCIPNIQSRWLIFYFLFAAIPAAICFYAAYSWERKNLSIPDYRKSHGYRVTGFIFMLCIFIVLASPWYYRTADALVEFSRQNLIQQKENLIGMGIDKSVKTNYLQNTNMAMFNYMPVFTAIGLFSIFFSDVSIKNHKPVGGKRVFSLTPRFSGEKIYSRLVLPASLIFSFYTMLPMLAFYYRLIIPFAVFSASLRGYWVGLTGKFRVLLSSAVMVLSCLSIFAWTFIPGDSPIYYPALSYRTHGAPVPWKILQTEGPNEKNYDFSRVIKSIDASMGGIILYCIFPGEKENMEHPVIAPDYISWELRKAGKVMPIELCRNDKKVSDEKLQNTTNILILHHEDSDPQPVIDRLKENRENMSFKTERFHIGEDAAVILMKPEK